MERALRLVVATDVASEGHERRTAEREIRAALSGRAEARDHDAVEAEGRDPIADALLRIGNDGPNLRAQVLKCSSAVLEDALEVIVDRRGFALCGHVTRHGTGSRTRLSTFAGVDRARTTRPALQFTSVTPCLLLCAHTEAMQRLIGRRVRFAEPLIGPTPNGRYLEIYASSSNDRSWPAAARYASGYLPFRME